MLFVPFFAGDGNGNKRKQKSNKGNNENEIASLSHDTSCSFSYCSIQVMVTIFSHLPRESLEQGKIDRVKARVRYETFLKDEILS